MATTINIQFKNGAERRIENVECISVDQERLLYFRVGDSAAFEQLENWESFWTTGMDIEELKAYEDMNDD